MCDIDAYIKVLNQHCHCTSTCMNADRLLHVSVCGTVPFFEQTLVTAFFTRKSAQDTVGRVIDRSIHWNHVYTNINHTEQMCYRWTRNMFYFTLTLNWYFAVHCVWCIVLSIDGTRSNIECLSGIEFATTRHNSQTNISDKLEISATQCNIYM